MNMTLSKRGDYAMRSAIFLARAPVGVARKVREVVADTEVPRAFAAQILADLVRAGLVTSRAGRDGGYALARPASRISALEIVEAAEGLLVAERCALGEGPCRWQSVCPLHETWWEASARVRDALAATSLAELAERDRAIEEGRYDPSTSHRRRALAETVSDARRVDAPAAAVATEVARLGSDLGGLVAQAVDAVSRSEVVDASARRVRGRRGAHDALRLQVVWRVIGGDAAGHVDGDLTVAPEGEATELRFEGTWHHGGDAPTSTGAAARVVRRFLELLSQRVGAGGADRAVGGPVGAS